MENQNEISAEDLHKLICSLQLYSLRTGEEFTLASGEKSNVYVDVKKTALNGRMNKLLAKLLWQKIGEFRKYNRVDAVAGVALGGCHLASIVGMHADLDVIHVRKEAKDHGTKNLLERPIMTENSQVVLIEDVVTTGESSIKAAEAIEEAGFYVVGIITVVDRRKDKIYYLSGKKAQWLIVSLVEFEKLLEEKS